MSKLKKFDCSKAENHLTHNLLFIGRNAQKVQNKSRNTDPTITSFLQEALEAYIKCDNYLFQKLPIDNQFLSFVSSIDPTAILCCSKKTLEPLLKRCLHIGKILLNEEIVAMDYERKCCLTMVPGHLTPGESTRAHVW